MAQRFWGLLEEGNILNWHSETHCIPSFSNILLTVRWLIFNYEGLFLFFFKYTLLKQLWLFSCKSRGLVVVFFFQNKNLSTQNHFIVIYRRIWGGDTWQKWKSSVLNKIFSNTGSTFCLWRAFSDTHIRKWYRGIIEMSRSHRISLLDFRIYLGIFPEEALCPTRKDIPTYADRIKSCWELCWVAGKKNQTL